MAIKLEEGEVYDIDKGEIVKLTPPATTKEEPAAATTTTEGEPTAEEKLKKQEALAASATTQVEEPEKEEEEEETEDKAEPEAEKTEPEKEEEEDEVKSLDDVLKQKYAEQYQIESEEDLEMVLGTIKEMEEENTALRAKLAEAEKSKPKFDSEQDEKAFEFLKTFNNLGEGMQTYATIVAMDVKSTEPRIVLEEKFIIEHQELSREEALKKFNRDYNRKYVLNKDTFDGDEAAFKEEEEMRKIDLKTDVAKARDFLSKKQTELKTKPKEAENNTVKANEAVQASIRTYDSELNEFMKDFTTIVFSEMADNDKDEFQYILTKEQKKEVAAGVKGWIGNPNSYNAKGELIGDWDAEQKSIAVAKMLFGEDMIAKAYKHGLSKGEVKRAEQIAKVKPDRVAKTANTADSANEEQQWEELARKKKAEREKRQFAH